MFINGVYRSACGEKIIDVVRINMHETLEDVEEKRENQAHTPQGATVAAWQVAGGRQQGDRRAHHILLTLTDLCSVVLKRTSGDC